MEDGINLMCPDGQRRLCFPVLAQYIADYEEQRVLASILNGYCPKCMIPWYHKPRGEGDLHSNVQEENWRAFSFPGSLPKTKWTGHRQVFTPQATHTSRTGFDAKRLRSLHRNEPATLHKFGYHVTKPFTERHIYSDIYSALAPDLLH